MNDASSHILFLSQACNKLSKILIAFVLLGDISQVVRKTLKSGNVSVEINREWYDKECILEYKSKNVSVAKITIFYKFDY